MCHVVSCDVTCESTIEKKNRAVVVLRVGLYCTVVRRTVTWQAPMG